MPLIEILATALLLLASAVVLSLVWAHTQARELHEHQQRRVNAFLSELAYARASQDRLDQFQDQVAASLDQGGRAARATHFALASIPFDILEQIPATRRTAQEMRRLHDLASDGVYAGLSLYAKWRRSRTRERNLKEAPRTSSTRAAIRRPQALPKPSDD
nr:hypothetical protein [Oceanococcus sp. HetDA_MAG_MS8]